MLQDVGVAYPGHGRELIFRHRPARNPSEAKKLGLTYSHDPSDGGLLILLQSTRFELNHVRVESVLGGISPLHSSSD